MHPIRRTRHGHHLGFTMVEMLTSVAITSFLFGVIAVTLHTLFQAQRAAQADMDFRRTLARLSLQFREDAHAAVSLAGDRQSFVLGDQQTVRYQLKPESNAIRRTVLDDGAEVGRQTFRLPRGATAEFRSTAQTPPQTITLTITQPIGDEAVDGRRTITIDAAVGLHAPRSPAPARDGREPE